MTTSAQPASAAAPKYKRSIKNYLLDAKFQLKWTGRIILVALAISALMGVFLYQTSREVTEQSQKVIAQGTALINESQKNSDLVKMQIKDQYADSPELAATFNKSADELDKQLQQKHTALEAQAATTKSQQQTMMLALIAGLTLLVVLIGLLGIYFTHKVVGPIYKMKMLLRQVGDGKLNFQGKLRKGDELQDFFEVFAGMVEKLKARQAAEVEELAAAITEAKESGASEA
ncbi:MAG: HAMP domain-containing protein, partial [Myxococcales bacterium]|nr:HAMP domain-containing protein [Myxococcales bacterium]